MAQEPQTKPDPKQKEDEPTPSRASIAWKRVKQTANSYFPLYGDRRPHSLSDAARELHKLFASEQAHRAAGGTIEKRPDGKRRWLDSQGQLHRADGPAVESPQALEWWSHGRRHREDGPAIEWTDGTRQWYHSGRKHRDGGPAVELASGSRYYYRYGKQHRDKGPAVMHADGGREWYLDGERHREDGPAIKLKCGTQEWIRNGERHREDGPAVIAKAGSPIELWFRDGIRVDPPAPAA